MDVPDTLQEEYRLFFHPLPEPLKEIVMPLFKKKADGSSYLLEEPVGPFRNIPVSIMMPVLPEEDGILDELKESRDKEFFEALADETMLYVAFAVSYNNSRSEHFIWAYSGETSDADGRTVIWKASENSSEAYDVFRSAFQKAIREKEAGKVKRVYHSFLDAQESYLERIARDGNPVAAYSTLYKGPTRSTS